MPAHDHPNCTGYWTIRAGPPALLSCTRCTAEHRGGERVDTTTMIAAALCENHCALLLAQLEREGERLLDGSRRAHRARWR